MAVRLISLHRHPLRIDLRAVTCDARRGQRSEVLLEELLYDNCHLSDWERAGWIRRVPARLSEAGAAAPMDDARPAAVAPPAGAAKRRSAAAGAARSAPAGGHEPPATGTAEEE